MTLPRSAFAAVVSLILAVAVTAFAEPAPAPAPGPAPTGHTAFALIVTNNRSGALGRPDLQYADDDGARYYELFQTLAPTSHLRLLTEFDRDTAREFPQLTSVTAAPSRANVRAAAAELAVKIADSERAGDAVDFYFVFAGHGDVDHGRGFVELTDGELDGDGLESLIVGMHATHAHIILDSCNSFFVISARKPGGTRFATPEDASTGLVRRLPNVGVFVSTSAEAEVFEWSELQSGVFSHAVRSGLAGAADANGDGVVTYDELRAFVDTATSEIRNAAFRPKVFARGPGGDDRAALFAHPTTGVQITLDRERAVRLRVRDHDELPWIDVYKEAGAPMTLRLPPGLLTASVDELAVGDGDAHAVRRYTVGGQDAALAVLPVAELGPAARGPDDLFRRLFTSPFGPAALATYDDARAHAPPVVYGISHDDATRMMSLVTQADQEQRENRMLAAASLYAIGAVEIGAGVFQPNQSVSDRSDYFVGAALLLGYATFDLLKHPAEEHLHEDFARALASGVDPSIVVADLDRRMHAAAHRAAGGRKVLGGLGAVFLAAAASGYLIDRYDNSVFSKGNSEFDIGLVLGATLGGIAVVQSFVETPIERTTRLWDVDPGISHVPAVGVAPVHGGAALSLSGRF